MNYIPAATNRQAMAPLSGAVRAPAAPRAPVSRPRSVKKSVAIIAGSTAAGAVIGGVTKGKKGAVIGGIVGGAAATIWDQITRRKTNPDSDSNWPSIELQRSWSHWRGRPDRAGNGDGSGGDRDGPRARPGG